MLPLDKPKHNKRAPNRHIQQSFNNPYTTYLPTPSAYNCERISYIRLRLAAIQPNSQRVHIAQQQRIAIRQSNGQATVIYTRQASYQHTPFMYPCPELTHGDMITPLHSCSIPTSCVINGSPRYQVQSMVTTHTESPQCNQPFSTPLPHIAIYHG